MSYSGTMAAELPDGAPFFESWDDVLRWLNIVRLIIWVLGLLRRLFCKPKKDAPEGHQPTMRSISSNEFGYVNFCGAY